jgi:hypothetical protein
MNITTMGLLSALLIVCGVFAMHLALTSPTVSERWAWIAGAFSFSSIGVSGLLFSVTQIVWSAK